MLVLKVASKPKLQKQQQQIIFHFQLAVAKMTYWTASFTPWLLLHIGTKLQKPTKNDIQKFVKLTGYSYVCNGLTNFECNNRKRKSSEFAKTCLEKNREIM